MSASWPSVSVVICAYNYERFVAESIDSALAQEYPSNRLEIIVVDDGSTDGTPDILARYADRVRVVRQPNAGLIAATARGIEESTGDLIAILDADDAWRPDKLRRQVELLQARPEVGLVFSDKEMVDEDGGRIAPSFFGFGRLVPPRTDQVTHLLAYNFVPAPSIVFRREHVGRILPFSPATDVQDWWMAIRVAQVAPLDYVPLPLVRYRVHGRNMNAGVHGEQLRKMFASYIGFRRWNLIHLDLDMVDPSGLHSAWQRHLIDADRLANLTGEPLEDVLLADRDVETAGDQTARAVAAFGEGRPAVAFRHLFAARVADPFDADVRTAYDEVLADLQQTEDAERNAARAAVLRTHGDTVRGRLAWARDLAASGRPGPAAQELLHLEKDTGATVEASAALAVAAMEAGNAAVASRAGRDALRAGSDDPAVLCAVARAANAVGDARAAAHWSTRATLAAPDDAAAWRLLGAAELARARGPEAVAALERAAALAPLPVDVEARLEEVRATMTAASATTSPAPDRAPGSLLLCIDRFGAGGGRLGRVAEALARELRALGWRIEIAARPSGDGRGGGARGLRIHPVRERPREELERVLARRRFDAVLVLGEPASWAVRHMLAIETRPRTVVIPSVTGANEHVVRDSPLGLRSFRRLLTAADVVVRSSRTGPDARLLDDLAVSAVDVPHPVLAASPMGSLRGRLRLSSAPLVLMPSFPAAQQELALVRAVCDVPGDWNLVVGAPAAEDDDASQELEALARRDRRLIVSAGLGNPLLAAGIREAALVIAAAPTGAVAPAVLAAMAAGVPWLAAPGSVADEYAGGVVVSAAAAGIAAASLLADPEAAARLGAAGRAEAAGRTPADAAARLDALLRGADRLAPAAAPAHATAVTDAAQADVLDRDVAPVKHNDRSAVPA